MLTKSAVLLSTELSQIGDSLVLLAGSITVNGDTEWNDWAVLVVDAGGMCGISELSTSSFSTGITDDERWVETASSTTFEKFVAAAKVFWSIFRSNFMLTPRKLTLAGTTV